MVANERIFAGFILTGYICVIGQLMAERRCRGGAGVWALKLVAGATVFSLCLASNALRFFTPVAVLAPILWLGNASAWRAPRDDAQVWNFTQKLWTGAIFATVGSVIFALALLVITEAVGALFGARLDRLTYDILIPIGLAFLAPVYWLGTLPAPGEADGIAEMSFEARALAFLGP